MQFFSIILLILFSASLIISRKLKKYCENILDKEKVISLNIIDNDVPRIYIESEGRVFKTTLAFLESFGNKGILGIMEQDIVRMKSHKP